MMMVEGSRRGDAHSRRPST